MPSDLLESLARSRIEQLAEDAAAYRALAHLRDPSRTRRALARVVRAFGYAALSLGDALAPTR